MRVNREEIFGPCASIIEARDFERVLESANDTPYGLTSGICTRSMTHASEFKRRSRAGMVVVNLPTASVDYHAPFRGPHGSSYGSREQGYGAVDFCTEVKDHLYLRRMNYHLVKTPRQRSFRGTDD